MLSVCLLAGSGAAAEEPEEGKPMEESGPVHWQAGGVGRRLSSLEVDQSGLCCIC